MAADKDFHTIYVFRKGDSLDKIAKAMGARSGDAIWKDPDNKALVKQRGRPENLQPGDKLAVSNDRRKVEKLQTAVTNLSVIRAGLKAQIHALQASMDTQVELTQQQVRVMTEKFDRLERCDGLIEVAKLAKNMSTDLVKMSQAAMRDVSGSEKALRKAQDDVMDAVIDLNKEPLMFAIVKIGRSDVALPTNVVALWQFALGRISDMTDPIWWLYTSGRLLRGDPPLQTLLDALGADIKRRIVDVQTASKKSVRELLAAQVECLKRLAVVETRLGQAEAGLKALKR